VRRKTMTVLLAVPVFAALSVVALPGASAAPARAAQPALSGKSVEYSVLAKDGVAVKQVEAAVEAAGGKVERSNAAVGLVTATAPENGFTQRLANSANVMYASHTRVIGETPDRAAGKPALKDATEHGKSRATKAARAAGMDPLDSQQWGLSMVRSNLSRTVQPGDKRVKVGILDTGVDGNHPDLKPNFDAKDSRNFTHDIPTDELGQVVDGPCEFRGCVDPANWDDGGHGTHVAGIIAAAANGLGTSGVAPNVTLVNIRGGQDSGFFFLQPVVDALTYAGDAGIDVVNMSFFVDPWLYNCPNNPADSPEEQAQQRTIITAMTRALNYAHRKGVSEVVALGNQHEDSGHPQPDATSPDFPANTARTRTVDNATCLTMPTEGPHSITVSALGPSGKKADYSSYGTERISVSAPGGYFRDFFGTPQFRTNENQILSTYPKNVGVDEGNIDPATGDITPAGEALGVQKACKANGVCGYYQFLQGTSMASPHATGVAALIVSQFGKNQGGGFGMAPDKVQRVLEGTAFATPCPVPRTVDYLNEGRDASFTATCEGDTQFNGFYGHGIVDAFAAVTQGKKFAK
jgi:subtilisin family serine protease